MGETTIGWTSTPRADGSLAPGYTFNPWIGCARVSPECDACYADSGSRRLAAQHGLKLWDGDRYFTGDDYWTKPLAWNRKAAHANQRAKVFCASFGDVFEERDDLVLPRLRLQGLIERTPFLDWLLLTKRPENMYRLAGEWRRQWPANVWAGTTVGVASSLKRAEALAAVPARVRFLSCEPLLGPLDLVPPPRRLWLGWDWVIVGSESGPRARRMETEWARGIVEQCAAYHVPCFVKQIATVTGKMMGDGHGIDPSWWPLGTWPREWPS